MNLNGVRQTEADARRVLSMADTVGPAHVLHLRVGKREPRVVLVSEVTRSTKE